MDSDDQPSRKRIKTAQLHQNTKKQDANICNIISLPHEVLVKVFRNLDFKTVSQCATLCQTFHKAANDPTLYQNVILQQGTTKEYLDAYTSKIVCPKKLTIVYKKDYSKQPLEDYTEFNQYVTLVLEKCNELLTYISVSNCRLESILKLVFDCEGLTKVNFKFCKGYSTKLLTTNLNQLQFETCDIPSTIMTQILKDNPNLTSISLVNNINLHTNGIAEVLGNYNHNIEDIHFVEKRRVRAKGVKAIARCNKLKRLLLSGSPYQCDPEDSLQQLAAGCPLLERLSIHGWKGITDDTLLPILQSCTQLEFLDFRGIDVTIKSCREAALSLPLLKHMDFDKCERIKKNQLLNLQKDFPEIRIVVY